MFHCRFHQHKTDFEKIPDARPILLPCKIKGCGCRSYHYVPLNGSQPIRCSCKHYTDNHTAVPPHKCKTGMIKLMFMFPNICFWCGSCWHIGFVVHFFVSMLYLLNHLMNFDQTCMYILVGGEEELIRFW